MWWGKYDQRLGGVARGRPPKEGKEEEFTDSPHLGGGSEEASSRRNFCRKRRFIGMCCRFLSSGNPFEMPGGGGASYSVLPIEELH